MVPDWPLYVPFGPRYGLTHSLAGLFTACLPIGLLIVLVFQLALKRPLAELLPQQLRQRLSIYLDQPGRPGLAAFLTVIVALLLGSATHVFWDSFTHSGTWGVRSFPQLDQVALTIAAVEFRAYMVLQHGSTLVGFPIFLVLMRLWYRKAEVREAPAPVLSGRAILFWRVFLLLIPSIFSVHMIWQLIDLATPWSVFSILYIGVTRCGMLIMIALAALGVHYRFCMRPDLLSAFFAARRSE